jgi:MFS transporter, DHA2 family, multidrug resistance protein
MASQHDIANRGPITGALMLATLMNTLDGTIANVALPHIQGSVSAAQDQVTWVLTSYIIATAIMMPLSGWISEKIGRKRMLMLSIGGFTIASMLCGVATNLPEIVIFRVIQGLAGASLMPMSQTVMLDLFPLKMVPRVMSMWSAAIMLGPIAGPTLGGWLTENLSWRWVFFINLPIGVAALFVLQMFMAEDPGGRQRPFDFIGFTSLTLFVGSFQLMLDRGPGQDWFGSTEIWIEAGMALLGLYLFTIQTLSARHPFFPRELAKDGNFVGGLTVNIFVGALLFSTGAILPSFMQNLLGYSALQSGYASVTRGFGSVISFVLVPMLVARLGAKPTLLLGVAFSGLSLWQMSRFNLTMSAELILLSGFVQGVGVGLMFAPISSLSYATLAPRLRPEGTILASMLRSLGSSIGISVVQASLVNQSALGFSRLSEHVTATSAGLAAALPPALAPDSVGGLTLLRGQIARQGAMLAYDTIFAWMAVLVGLLVPLVLMLKRPPPPIPTEPAAQPEPIGE